jgi:hypothetical protein
VRVRSVAVAAATEAGTLPASVCTRRKVEVDAGMPNSFAGSGKGGAAQACARLIASDFR